MWQVLMPLDKDNIHYVLKHLNTQIVWNFLTRCLWRAAASSSRVRMSLSIFRPSCPSCSSSFSTTSSWLSRSFFFLVSISMDHKIEMVPRSQHNPPRHNTWAGNAFAWKIQWNVSKAWMNSTRSQYNEHRRVYLTHTKVVFINEEEATASSYSRNFMHHLITHAKRNKHQWALGKRVTGTGVYFVKTTDLPELQWHLQKLETHTKIYSIDSDSQESTNRSLPRHLLRLLWHSLVTFQWTGLNNKIENIKINSIF